MREGDAKQDGAAVNTHSLRLPVGAGAAAWTAARRLLLSVVLIGLAYAALQILLSAPLRSASLAALPMLLLAAVIYLASHALRILRLALLIGDSRIALRDIADFQLTTAAVTLAAPFKIGEVYRLYELANLVGGALRAVIITWWERVFDAVFLLLILAITFLDGEYLARLSGVGALIGVFVLGTAVTFFVLPDNLRRLSVLIIRRYSSPRTVSLLKGIDMMRRAILEAPRLVRGKMASLLVLTGLIWAAQVACVMIAYPRLGGDVSAASTSLLDFLSSLLRSRSPLSALANGAIDRAAAAQALVQAPLIFIGLIAGIHYLVRRMRPSGSGLAARR